MTQIKLQDIYIYPIKSCAGIRVNRWPVTQKGLMYDRQWMIIDQNGQFLSQRKLPQMALIQPTVLDQQLVLSAPEMEEIQFSIEKVDTSEVVIQANIWQDQCRVKPVSNELDQWLSDFLKINCRLVYQDQNDIRQVDQHYAKPQDQVYFSDGFPFLIISENSLADLISRMPYKISMLRFRPNLVISGSPSFAEDHWQEIEIGEISFRLPKPCSRCPIPNIDPKTGKSSKETIKTLNQYRRFNNQVYFGQNALHNVSGQLSIDDPVKILLTGDPQPPLTDSNPD
jgi:uncharacterized protein YcbX